ncbi:MAG: creatininase family protein [Chloroflexota bacterium]|nr:MAG: creatininase family protein [Chloroflexota bacterium]
MFTCLAIWGEQETQASPETFNLGGRVFEDFFLAIIDRLEPLGTLIVYFSNGHGGNHSFLVNVIQHACERFPHIFIATEWLHTNMLDLATYRQGNTGGMVHGGELETRDILHLFRDQVNMDHLNRKVEFNSTSNDSMDWIAGGSLVTNPLWTDDSFSGIYGDGTLGTATKGLIWLEQAAKQIKI